MKNRIAEIEPGTPSLAGILAAVGGSPARGSPARAPGTSAAPRTAGGPVLFGAGSTVLSASARTTLLRSCQALGDDPGLRVLIGGLTSPHVFRAEAMSLALGRVAVVRSFLHSRGIESGRIDVAVCGGGWFLVERAQTSTRDAPPDGCLLEILGSR